MKEILCKTRTVTSEIYSWDNLPLLLSSEQASQVLGYSKERIRQMCNAKIIPHIREGRHFRIPKEALQSWILKTSMENVQIALSAVRNEVKSCESRRLA